ncbi:S9 family peptidase [Streptomyces qinzhouensis]|uniref:Prolyl oligopeptidase family serine peptidase n=1 Tax=Streptomyces qinzhouensis TaxID=2599401 RepID=A0A5B8JF20_9ACTN|nr:prolyl oligopeptidase family serine peptidase [Streptomyces qinzhouensis]QDY78864.1 prolyl oligopeptidase family serine peptidase [Streptomyces qinzhouensis]
MTMRQQSSFPRQFARTQRFSLGAPRSFTVAPDGSRVVFIRSVSGTEREGALWVLDLDDHPTTVEPEGAFRERSVADPRALLGNSQEQLSAAELARRERSRDGSAGIVGYAVDGAAELAAFSLSGRLFTAELRTGASRELPVRGPVLDPRPAPDGRRIAYVSGGALRVVGADGTGDLALAEPSPEETEETGAGGECGISYGSAEYIAAESMGRDRGYWWSPESDRLLVARVDERAVRRWWIADPARPDRAPRRVAYPSAGTPNAEVRLFLVPVGGGGRTEVVWDRAAYPYLARVHWSAAGPPLLLVQARDQRTQRCLAVDTGSGETRTVHLDEDPIWLDLFAGVPARTPRGQLVRIADEGGARVLTVGDRALTGAGLQVRAVLAVGDEDVLVSASAGAEAAAPELGEVHVYRVGERGVERISEGRGVHTAVRSGAVTVLVSARPDTPDTDYAVLRDGKRIATIASYAEEPVLTARPRLVAAGERRIPCAVLLPRGYEESRGPLPVLMDPYGGPHARKVVAAHNAHLTSQWFADQGFAVVVADGRGTPGPTPAWEKAVAGDFGMILDDQIAALHALAGDFPLDLGRVAIRGWSFGGFLAALAVLRRPDVFHAAIAGAPATDQRLYDTHYTERYLGHPDEHPEVYAANSLITDEGLSGAAEPARPLMIVHGFADDNVVIAHSLRLSSALLAAGRPHEVLPLSGVTHMTPQEEVAENLLHLQVDFLRRSLGAARRAG